jgi:hypothetical protein
MFTKLWHRANVDADDVGQVPTTIDLISTLLISSEVGGHILDGGRSGASLLENRA